MLTNRQSMCREWEGKLATSYEARTKDFAIIGLVTELRDNILQVLILGGNLLPVDDIGGLCVQQWSTYVMMRVQQYHLEW